MEQEKRVSRRWRTVAVLAVGVLVGVALAAGPAQGHFGTVKHLWNHHIKPKADARYINNNETASNADMVDNVHAKPFAFTGGVPTGATEVLNIGGLVLNASCDAIGDLTLVAETTSDNALIRVSSVNAGGAFANGSDDYDIADPPVDMLPGGDTGAQATVTYSRPFVSFINQGATVTATFTADEDAFGANNCVVRGIANAYTPGIFIIIGPKG